MSAQPLRYTGAPARRAAILENLRATGFASISDLSERLGVSEMTARRDVRRLQDEGEAVAVHGASDFGPPRRMAPVTHPSTTGGNARETRPNTPWARPRPSACALMM